METARKLAEGVAGWLLYEFHCSHTPLFNERYLSVPIANILHTSFEGGIFSEFVHPILAKHRKGRGRPPEVDFAVSKDFPNISCVVESKWVGANSIKIEDILWDLLRLELIATKSEADAYFLLAGRHKHVEKFLKSSKFLGEDGHSPLLSLPEKTARAHRIESPFNPRVEEYKSVFRNYQNVDFPTRLALSQGIVYPRNPSDRLYQVLVWKVIGNPSTARFKPANHASYKSSRRAR